VYATGGQYATWATFLESWMAGGTPDPATLPAIAEDDLNGNAWERFVNRLTEALSVRLQAWADVLSRELSGARDEFAAARALHQARTQLGPIRAVAGHRGLPDALRDRLLGLIESQLVSLQASLEDQVQRLQRTGTPRSAVEARLRTVRENALTTPPAAASGTGWDAGPRTRSSRRVIID
jgi:hypothetical protein